MRRRRLLAAIAAGTLGAASGCGYAYGGGDVRDAGSVGTSGFGETRYVLADERIVAAKSGRHFWHGEEEPAFDDGTSVTVVDRSGERRWRYKHRSRSEAVAGWDPVYLLDEQNRVVALAEAPPDDDSSGQRRRPYDGEERWRTTVDDARTPFAADSRGAYVAVDGGVAAVRNGEEVWRIGVREAVESLHASDGTLLVGTPDAVVAVDPAGSERWRQATDDVSRFATAAGRVVIYDGSRLTVRRLPGGDRRWTTRTGHPGGRPALTADRVYVVASGGVSSYDAETGNAGWHSVGVSGLEPSMVPAPEGVYAARRGCEALALGRNGVRWARELSVRSCGLVGGWLDGESVAFLFDSGELRWLQRTDQDTGLV